MRLALALLLLASAARAEPALCPVFQDWSGAAPLDLGEARGRLVLRYRGPMEPDIGRFFPMKATVQGRAVQVTIAERSRPSSPSGITLPAGGQNHGEATLPAGLSGRYTLVVRQGRLQGRYDLQISAAAVTVRPLAPPAALRLDVPADGAALRRLPPGAVLLRCYGVDGGCPADTCDRLFAAPVLGEMTALPAGRHLYPGEQRSGHRACLLRPRDPGQIAALRATLAALRTPTCLPGLVDVFGAAPDPASQ